MCKIHFMFIKCLCLCFVFVLISQETQAQSETKSASKVDYSAPVFSGDKPSMGGQYLASDLVAPPIRQYRNDDDFMRAINILSTAQKNAENAGIQENSEKVVTMSDWIKANTKWGAVDEYDFKNKVDITADFADKKAKFRTFDADRAKASPKKGMTTKGVISTTLVGFDVFDKD